MNYWCFLVIGILCACDIGLANPVSSVSQYLVGVSNKKLNDLVAKALEGLRKVILNGDKRLNISSLEPFLLEENYMSYNDDRTGQNRVYVASQGISFLHGLSSYTVDDVSASMKELNAEIKLTFNLLQGFGKYKLGGHLFGGIIELAGNGSVAATSRKVDTTICLNMTLVDSKLDVDQTSIKINLADFWVKAPNVMGVSGFHAVPKLNEILQQLYIRYKKTVDNAVNEFIEQVAENTFTGMTLQELIDLLQYLSKKASSGSALPNAAIMNVS